MDTKKYEVHKVNSSRNVGWIQVFSWLLVGVFYQGGELMAFHRLNKLAVKRYLHFWWVEAYRIGCGCISGVKHGTLTKKIVRPGS